MTDDPVNVNKKSPHRSLNPSEATLLCRISSDKQAEGYSLDFQEKGGLRYAERQNLAITKTWRLIESASKDSREKWREYFAYATTGKEAHILIPKVDRSLRNFDDLALIIKIPVTYGKTLHFFDDGIVFHKDSPASDLLRLGIQGTVATWYSVDLAQKTRKGMDEKVAQGEWPGIAPFGYKNNKVTKLIEIDPNRSHWVRRIKELSAKGIYSLDRIKEIVVSEGYVLRNHRLHRNQINRIIRNPLYAGFIEWPSGTGMLVPGKHEPTISWELHEAAVRGLERLNRPRYRKHDFAYAGMIRCGLCDERRAIVFEIKKKRFVYAHCTGVRRNNICPNARYVRLEKLEEQVAKLLRQVQITPEVSEFILSELSKESGHEMAIREAHLATMRQELGRLRSRLDSAYADKLDGKITEEFWLNKSRAWQTDAIRLEEKIKQIESSGPVVLLPRLREVLELSENVATLFLKADSEQKRELLNYTCSNLLLVGENLSFSYKRPFDILAEGVRTGNWRPLRDKARTHALDRFQAWLLTPETYKIAPNQAISPMGEGRRRE